MSYLVLARKWRPRDFESLVGQEHVVRALTHALTTQRLHHAWLFTGTRGVGKTTLSRILAKSLNCEQGITAKPCGQCMACQQIDAGRFVDYVELDAASNRGVDEMTQLLEQAVYAPTAARFKIYMIDEVHMLTGHAFNAMLKTLEEPPPHVKFILATTDPQKILPTVLSRCLQFNLKQMTPESIATYLAYVLEQEQVSFEPLALRLIGQAASGSMRDALSLTDQAIAFSAGELTTSAVRSMLGSVDQTMLVRLLQALCQADAQAVLEVAGTLSERGLSLRTALADLAVLLSRIAILQRTGACELEDEMLRGVITELAEQMPTDLVQLFYTVAVHSRQELSLAPDEYAGFVMVCLRMLGFVESLDSPQKKTLKFSSPPEPEAPHGLSNQSVELSSQAASEPRTTDQPVLTGPGSDLEPEPVRDEGLVAGEAVAQASAPPDQTAVSDLDVAPTHNTASDQAVFIPPWEDEPASDHPAVRTETDHAALHAEQMPSGRQLQTDATTPVSVVPDGAPKVLAPLAAQQHVAASLQSLMQDWASFVTTLPISGMARELAMQSVCVEVSERAVVLRVPAAPLARGPHVKRLTDALAAILGQAVALDIVVGDLGSGVSAQQLAQQHAQERLEQAQLQLQTDPFVQALIQDMGAQIVPGTVRA